MKRNSVLLAALLLAAGAQAQAPLPQSEWVRTGARNKLVYKTLERGDRIMDFSYAGYGGGGVSLPSPPVKITLSPVAGDNTDAIQRAIDEISALPPVNGFRGALLLKPGTYALERAITIRTGGVVLRGSGSGENGTILQLTGKPHACILAGGAVRSSGTGTPAKIADAYVAAGTFTFQVESATGLAPGDTIVISKPVTPAWIKLMDMAALTRDGKKQTWMTGVIPVTRAIKKIDGNRITVDLPLTDNYDAHYLRPPGVEVQKVSNSGIIANVGIEHFRITCASQSVTINEGHHKAFSMRGLTDGWASDIAVFNTVNSISVSDASRVTIDQVSIMHEVPTIGAAKPADFNGSGSQLLFNRCTIQGDNVFFFATGAKVSGPVVLLHCTFRGNGWIQPHQRWATGVLVDNCHVPDGGIDFMNRGIMGSGHGWSVGFAVAWNCKARSYLNQMPPGAANWVIGCEGEKARRAVPFDTIPYVKEGIYDAHGTPVTPGSLYLAQLSERLGKQALKNIGY
ncbi:hypothetical protein EGT74_15915 [Chitinophaga lutea]|uniref:Pectate lyase superfamily protein domain-containing protein n=1 Tax=Chitinophaga lutea TaxID=2488634 RepID=A0A3N4PJY5_9BACT|nr:hypothetical protein [Chitinophaga lutea]RPE08526.1 hypothetical protein EGT74_15915 [Chitinophaga lutea]